MENGQSFCRILPAKPVEKFSGPYSQGLNGNASAGFCEKI